MIALEYLDRAGGRRLAYSRVAGAGDGAGLPGIVFLGGLRSDMTGTKAEWLEAWARKRGRAFLRFDYSGHGASEGRFEDGAISDWLADAEAALTALTAKPQILVGSSMGGWIALLLALRHPHQVAGIVGIAAAPDFTEDGMWAKASTSQREALQSEGRFEVPSEYGEPMVITRRLIEDGRDHLVLRKPLGLRCPLRLLHGTADPDVPMDTALRLLEHVDCDDARLTLVKGAGHRFSDPRELSLIGKTLHGLTQAADGASDGASDGTGDGTA